MFWSYVTGSRPDSIDEQFRDLLNNCWAYNGEQRFSVEDALAHAWMNVQDDFDASAYRQSMQ